MSEMNAAQIADLLAALDARREGMEAAAKICDEYADKWRDLSSEVARQRTWAADNCADAIRAALAQEKKREADLPLDTRRIP